MTPANRSVPQDSAVRALQRGEVRIGKCPPEVVAAAAPCTRPEAETGGWFRATRAGTLDRSGAVNAWVLAVAAAF